MFLGENTTNGEFEAGESGQEFTFDLATDGQNFQAADKCSNLQLTQLSNLQGDAVSDEL